MRRGERGKERSVMKTRQGTPHRGWQATSRAVLLEPEETARRREKTLLRNDIRFWTVDAPQ